MRLMADADSGWGTGQGCGGDRQLQRAGITEKMRAGEGKDEYRLRNWLWDRALSGDILVEQNIHIIDLVQLDAGGASAEGDG